MNSRKLMEMHNIIMGNSIVTEEPELAKKRRDQLQKALNQSTDDEDMQIIYSNNLTDLENSNFEWGLTEGYRMAFRVIMGGIYPITDCTEEQAFTLIRDIRNMNAEQLQAVKEMFKDSPDLLNIITLAEKAAGKR